MSNHPELEDPVTGTISFFRSLDISSFKLEATAKPHPIPSIPFAVYKFLPIGVRERHHVVKARMFCSCLARNNL